AVRPENILVDRDGAARLTDFGVAARSGPPAPEGAAYLAPERWSGAPATPAADVYAATAVFYECLTGAAPYTGTLAELAEAHRGAPPALDAVPEPLRMMTAHGLAKTPSARPSSASALLSEAHMLATPIYGPDWEPTAHYRLATQTATLAAKSRPRAPAPPPGQAAAAPIWPEPTPFTAGPQPAPYAAVPGPVPPRPEPAPCATGPGPGSAMPGVASHEASGGGRGGRMVRWRVLVPAVLVAVALVVVGVVLLRPGARAAAPPRSRPSVAAAGVPGVPPGRARDALAVVRRQMAAKRTAAFTYARTTCCGLPALHVTGARLSLAGGGAIDAARVVTPGHAADTGMRTPARVVVIGTRTWVNLHGGWAPKAKPDGDGAARRARYAKSGLAVLDQARLNDLDAVLAAPTAKPTAAATTGPTRHAGGVIEYRGKVRADRRLLKRLGIASHLPATLAYRIRLSRDYLPRFVSLKITLAPGTPRRSVSVRRITYGSWGTARPVTPPV
ncbi:MAG TPA: protein kinase, partial [Streptosporangiaceae bacterium]